MTINKRIILLMTVLLICVSCDQGTKSIAESYLPKTEVWSFWGDTVRLQLAHNSGAFLSLGAALPDAWRAGLFSAGVALLLIVLMGYILFSKSLSSLEIIALTLMLAGGVGNLIDRMLFGYVVDFMNIGVGALRTGVFNVADMAVSAGVLLLFADMVKPAATSD
ncbi:MAG: signal peptidase II [Gammaproteobacteria bacterium]|nr:signal peptidase II [Gammaproteobacteria bacterium]